MASRNQSDKTAMAISNALTSWNIGVSAKSKIVETYLVQQEGKDMVYLEPEEAEKVLTAHARDKEDSENFLKIVESNADRAWDRFHKLLTEKQLTVKEISTTEDNLRDEAIALANWLTCFTLGILPGINEKGFVVADQMYSRRTCTVYNAICYEGHFTFEELEQVPYNESQNDKGIMCYYSKEAQTLVKQLVMRKFSPVITPGANGHMELRFNGTVIRRFVKRELSETSAKSKTIVSFTDVIKVPSLSQG